MQLYTFIVIPKAPTKKMVHLKIVQGRQRRTPIAHIKVYWRETTLEEVSNTPEDRMSQSRSLSLQLLWHLNRITMNQNDHKECRTLTASSFRFWNSSTGILSPLLALFTVMLPKAHLTSHARMPGCRWVITPSWLSGSTGLEHFHSNPKEMQCQWMLKLLHNCTHLTH